MILLSDIKASRAPLAAFGVVGIAWGGFAAQVPVIKAQVGAGDGVFGGAMFVAAFGAVAAMWLAPWLDRHLDRRGMAVLGLGLALSFVMPGLFGTAGLLAAALLVCSAFSGSLDVIMNARLSRIEAACGRPLMNFAHATFSLAYAIAAVIAGLAREAGWAPVSTFTLLACLSIGLCLVALQDDLPSELETGQSRAVVPWAGIMVAGAIVLIAFMAEQATEGWSALHLERGLGAGAVEGAFGPALLGLTMAAGRFAGQALIQAMSEVRLLAIALCVSAIGCALAASASALPQAYVGFAFLGLGVSVVVPTCFALIGKRASDETRTTAISRLAVLGYSGFFIGPPIMGLLSEFFGLPIAFGWLAVMLALAALVLTPLLGAQGKRLETRNAQ